jgi:hypothetical protein
MPAASRVSDKTQRVNELQTDMDALRHGDEASNPIILRYLRMEEPDESELAVLRGNSLDSV